MRLLSFHSAVMALRKALLSTFEAKVMLLSVAAAVSGLAMSFSIFQWLNWSAGQDNFAHDQIDVSQHLAAALADPAAANDVATARAIFNADQHSLAATFVFDDGRRVRFARPGAPSTAPDLQRGVRPSARLHMHGVEIHLPQIVQGRRVGELIFEADNDEVRATFGRNVLVTAILSLLATVLAAAVARTLARRALRPLYSLNTAIEEVRRSKDFGNEVFTTSTDEFGRLTDNFNALLIELTTYSGELREALAEVTAARDGAERANFLKSQFLANMSHEIRTPLNGVLGMAQAMSAGDLSTAQRERLEIVQRSGASLLAILNDILDLSKIEAGFLKLEAAPFDIEQLAGDACALFTSTASAKGLSLTLDIADTAKGSWRGDAARLRQVLSNLVSNAVKFTEQGEIRVRVEKESSQGSDMLVIAISDTGIGVSAENLPKLFEKFVQEDSSITRRFGGTGLGLTISRHLIELMGGTIGVESTVGVGTVFQIRAPLTWLGPPARVVGRPPKKPISRPDLSSLRVLAAEDNGINRLVLTTLLQSFGVTAVMVADGREAVEAWKAGDFDLLLMDVQMPVLDGVAATREIRAIERKTGRRPIRIIAVSANAMSHQIAEYLAAGMDGHVSKPIAIDRLHDALAEVVRPPSRRAARSA